MKNRSKRGDVIVETVVGLTFLLIPLGLLAVDIATVYLCSRTNDRLAHSAARAAAQTLPTSFGRKVTGPKAPNGVDTPGGDINAPTTVQNVPSQVARSTVSNNFKPNNIIEDAAVCYFAEKTQYYEEAKHFPAPAPPPAGATDGDPPVGQAIVVTAMKIRLPIPLPGLQTVILHAQATEAVTSVPWVPNKD